MAKRENKIKTTVTFRTTVAFRKRLRGLCNDMDQTLHGVISQAVDRMIGGGTPPCAEVKACSVCGEISYGGCEHATIGFDSVEQTKEGYERITLEVPKAHAPLLREVARDMQRCSPMFTYLKTTWREIWNIHNDAKEEANEPG